MTVSMRTGWAGRLAIVLLALQFTPAAQVEFDAASIKESQNLNSGGSLRFMPGGGITAEHLLVRQYITIAYGLQSFQLVRAPDWTRDTYYDIVAKPAGAASREQALAMLQTLLTDRFKLTSHREKRQMDGFALVRARTSELGPSLRPSTVNCETQIATVPKCREGRFSTAATVNMLKLVGAPMWSLLQPVINQLNAPVNDETQLAGTFDIDLRWSSDVAPADDLPSLFTALQEQLGLKLERRRVTEEIFVVDRIERPTPD
jgi:uncharacterized protein (TIGR03435 family)